MPRLNSHRNFSRVVVFLPALTIIVFAAWLILPARFLSFIEPKASAAGNFYVVTNTNDSGPGSFRQAVEDGVGDVNGTITFDLGPGPHTIELLTALSLIRPSIIGPGSNLLTIKRSTASGTPDFRVLSTDFATNISGITISNGKARDAVPGRLADNGGGILMSSTSTTLTDVVVTGNKAGNGGTGSNVSGSGGLGGGIFATFGRSVTLINCVISGNSAGKGADVNGGSGGDGGGIGMNVGSLTVVNTVINGNRAGDGGNGSASPGGNGGGVYIPSGAMVQLTNSTVSGNSAGLSLTGPSGDGGGINNQGTLNVINTTISGNSSLNSGGGIRSKGVLTATNITVSGNQGVSGGGIADDVDATTTLANSTITNNTASSFAGGALTYADKKLTVRNTIIAGNIAVSSPDVTGNFNSLGNNLIGIVDNNASGFTNGTNGDQVGTSGAPIDSKLAPLANNGGLTRTHALLSGSPAIDKGDASSTLSTDQRGGLRPVDGDNNGSSVIDIGAFEFGAGVLTVTKTADTNDAQCDSDCSLREAVAGANTNGLSTNAIVFNMPLTDPGYNGPAHTYTIKLAGTELNLNGKLALDGQGFAIDISGNKMSRLFNINSGATVSISKLMLSNGNSTGAGGAILNGGTLMLLADTLYSDSASTNGGAIQNTGTLSVTNSTISGNSAAQGGGIFNSGAGTVNINNSTIVSNSASQAGGGIFNNSTGAVKIQSTIIGLNTSPASPDIAGTATSLGNNIIKDTRGATISAATGDQFNVDPQVEVDPFNLARAVLRDNGGPTQTIALQCESTAQAHGIDNLGLGVDQRGFPRPAPILPVQPPDVGAFESFGGCRTPKIFFGVNPSSVEYGGNVVIGARLLDDSQIKAVFPFETILLYINDVFVGSVYTSDTTLLDVSVAGLSVGTYSVKAVHPGSPRVIASTATTSLTIVQATPQITWNNPADITFGTLLSSAQLNATASTPGSFSYIPAAGTKLGVGSNQSLFVTFTPTDTTNFKSASKTVLINVLKASQTINFGPLPNKTYGDPPFTVNATASSGLPVSFSIVSGPATISGNTVTLTGSGTVTVRASQAGDSNFNAAVSVDQSFTVSPGPSTLKLDQNSYTVSEDAGQVTINILRTGDTLSPLTVNYTTADGTALEHSDYNRASGTVSFAAGETSKAVIVLINQDSFQEGAETFSFTLSSPTGGGSLGQPSSAFVVINDDDTAPPTTNVIDDARNFVRQQYHDFLNREPDQSGLDYWTGQITQCGSDQVCVRSRRIAVSNAFFFEAEYQQTGAYVFRLYRAAFGNNQPFPNPDSSNVTEAKKLPSYAVYTSDRTSVIGGANLAQSQLDLANLFVQRPEFVTKYPAGLDGPAFVDALLGNIQTDLGVDLSSQRSALINLFNQGGRGAVLYRLADDNANNPINNKALLDAEYNRAFVITQYFGYLRRDPDIGGYLFWLDQVNRFPVRNTSIQNAMVCSFITSREYQERFSSIVTHSNSECPH